MPNDARISTTFSAHPKTKKLLRRHGHGTCWGLVCLFLWTAGNRPDGDLSGMSNEDIELAVDWTGAEGALVAALKDVGFLDGQEFAYSIHDWAEHNPWAAGAKDRSEASKWAALCKRYGREKAAEMMPDYAHRMRPAREPDAGGKNPQCEQDAETAKPECPATVSVSVSDTATDSKNPLKPPKGGVVFSDDFKTWYAAYPLKVAPKRAWKAFQRAVYEGVDLKTLLDGVERYRRSKPEAISWAHPASWLNDGRWNDGIGDSPADAKPETEEQKFTRRAAEWAKSPKAPDQRWWHPDWGLPPHKREPDSLAIPAFLKRSA